jgi:GntR family transcriptional regulator
VAGFMIASAIGLRRVQFLSGGELPIEAGQPRRADRRSALGYRLESAEHPEHVEARMTPANLFDGRFRLTPECRGGDCFPVIVRSHAATIPRQGKTIQCKTWIPSGQVSLTLSYVAGVTVDHGSPVPAYLQLAEILRQRIRAGEFRSGPLPSNRTLRETYDVGEFAVTHAIKTLEAEGLVFSVPRRGVYVTPEASAGPS